MSVAAMVDAAAEAAILSAVDAGYEAQTQFLAAFVRIPSTRGQEGPAQGFMAAALRARGYSVDDWPIRIEDLQDLPGYGPVESDFSQARTVVGGHRPREVKGRSLIVQGHCDVVPAGPLDMWTIPPYEPRIVDGWMHGRGAGDMKAGTVAALFALDAIRAAGYEPAAPVHFQSVIEEESTGLGALSTCQRGYRADCVLIPEPSDCELVRAQVGVLWFKLRVRGRPVHVAYAGTGSNAILATFHVIEALRELEAQWNERAKNDRWFEGVQHPLNFNVGKIVGGDWASSVPAWCDADCRIGILPGTAIADAQREVAECVAAAAKEHPFLRETPPEVIWNGFLAEGWALEDAEPQEACLRDAYRAVAGSDAAIADRRMTALTDTRFYGLYYGMKCLCFGHSARNIHGFDEAVDLESVRRTTKVMAAFIARWCGLNQLS